MNKLLLLATSLICLSFNTRGYDETKDQARHLTAIQQILFNDSTIKESGLNDLKAGFKDLFESETVNGISMEHLNPKAMSFVQDYMDENGGRLNKMKSWGKPYFDLIGDVFTQNGLPIELKYLAVIESDLKSSARSWAGAVGPWQLMAETARDFGLTVNKKKDERLDYQKSTRAAAKYLNVLYREYNDWLLVIAAYNCGVGNVNSAIRRSGSHNFWELQNYLPAESRMHVKKFIATHYIMEGEGGVTTLTKKETDKLMRDPALPIDASFSVVSISGRYTASAIANAIQMSITDFNRYNPTFDKSLAANGSYTLRLPNDKMNLFQASKPQILQESINALLSTVSL